jgi:FAD/FMN-containing dehydrogenase
VPPRTGLRESRVGVTSVAGMVENRLRRRTVLGAGVAGLLAAGIPWPSGASTVDWSRLRLDGDLVLPADPAYPTAKQLDSGYYDSVNPAAIAYCVNAQDVQTCLMFAQDNDITVAVRSGGHSAAGYSTTTGLVLDVSRLDGVTIGSSTVQLGPGTQSVDAVAALASQGLSLVTGNGATVCAGGFLQGGGIGLQNRKYGIASDRLVSADVVLASGRLVHCSRTTEPDLFWALRGGGGGNFGVVTRFEIQPTDVAQQTSFTLMWTVDHAAAVILAFQQWLAAAPDDLAPNMTVMWQSGAQPVVMVTGAWYGEPAALTAHLDALVSAAGAAPTTRTADPLTYQQAMMRMYGCADKSVPQCHRVGDNPDALLPRHAYSVERGRMVGTPLTAAAVDEVLTVFQSEPVAGQSRFLNMLGLGGAVNRVSRTATAYVHRDALCYLGFSAGLASFDPGADERAAVDAWLGRCWPVAQRYGNGESYVNFISPGITDWRQAFYGENYTRLVRTKRMYDPHSFFRFPQAIGS